MMSQYTYLIILFLIAVFTLDDVCLGRNWGDRQVPEQEVTRDSKIHPLVIMDATVTTIESIEVSGQVPGLIRTLSVKEGGRLEAGKEIGRIDDSAPKLQLERAKNAILLARKKQANDIDRRLAEKRAEVAKNEYQRGVDANSRIQGSYPPNEIDRLQLIYQQSLMEIERSKFLQEVAAIDVTAAEIEYRQILDTINRHRILAPCSGTVVAIQKRAGEWVEPGNVILRIVDLDRLRIEGFLSVADASPSLVGSKATVELIHQGERFETTATLVFISPDVNQINSLVKVFLEVENHEGRLRPGLHPKTVLNIAGG